MKMTDKELNNILPAENEVQLQGVKYHEHNGFDSPRIDFEKLNPQNQRIFANTTDRDTFLNSNDEPIGVRYLIYDGTNYREYVKMTNGTTIAWRYITLT